MSSRINRLTPAPLAAKPKAYCKTTMIGSFDKFDQGRIGALPARHDRSDSGDVVVWMLAVQRDLYFDLQALRQGFRILHAHIPAVDRNMLTRSG